MQIWWQMPPIPSGCLNLWNKKKQQNKNWKRKWSDGSIWKIWRSRSGIRMLKQDLDTGMDVFELEVFMKKLLVI